jgi:hypothetical protein
VVQSESGKAEVRTWLGLVTQLTKDFSDLPDEGVGHFIWVLGDRDLKSTLEGTVKASPDFPEYRNKGGLVQQTYCRRRVFPCVAY